tara:strand:- start:4000 stop:4272 length:273 start_codon:yes stop_codon:yes gene_type:complete
MSVRNTANAQMNQADRLRADIQSARSSETAITWESLSETEKSASSIGVSPGAWKPIAWMNQGHYGELLRSNSLGGRLTQQIESFKAVSSA